MNYYQYVLISFTILLIIILGIIYYLLSSNKTPPSSKYNNCPDFWGEDPSTGKCDPFANSFINFISPDTTSGVAITNSHVLKYDLNKKNVISGNIKISTTASLQNINATAGYPYDINTSAGILIKTNPYSTDRVVLYFVVKIIKVGSVITQLFTSCNYNDTNITSYSYNISVSSAGLLIIKTNNNGTAKTYTATDKALVNNKNYIIKVVLKNKYIANESPEAYIDNSKCTFNTINEAIIFDLSNTGIYFGDATTLQSITALDPATNNYHLGQFIQFNYNNDTLNNNEVFLAKKWGITDKATINTVSNKIYVDSKLNDISKGSSSLVDFKDPSWYSTYESSSLECSWQQWCNENKIVWSGINNGTFCKK